ncbi:MAG: DNA translocase FtsK [Saezia sp.]
MASYQIGTSRKEKTPVVKPVFRFTQELVLLITALVGVVIFLALLTYSPRDAAWSTSGLPGAPVSNSIGVVGAWISDLLYYFFGYSVWWLLLVCAVVWIKSAIRVFKKHELAVVNWKVLIGLILLLFSSCALEWSRLYYFEQMLPWYSAGGVLGRWLGELAQYWMGFAGSGLFWIILFFIGLSYCLGFSWLNVAEKFGGVVESLFISIKQKLEAVRDEKLGLVAAQEREDEMRQQREKDQKRPTSAVMIEPVFKSVPESERVVKERQKPLFNELDSISGLPEIALLDTVPGQREEVSPDALEMTSRLIEKKLADFGIEAQVTTASPGPVITRYEFEPARGVKGAQIVNLARDLARSLGIMSLRVIETVPGKTTMALELPNAKRQMIYLSEIIGSTAYHNAKSLLTVCLGKDIVGRPVVADLAKMPHVLVAGTTGSGKSVGINAMILSILYKADPSQVRMLMIDPKMLEMSVYNDIPHLLAPVVTDMKQAAYGLNWCVAEMERRYKLMSKLGVRNIAGFNSKIQDAKEHGEIVPNPFSLTPEDPEPLKHMPYIVVVIDELADLMMVVGKKIEELIARLAQKARACGIHLVLATQRPSVDVITGLIKANIPTRISFQVSSRIDSRTILDQMGAESLLGMGDMLYLAPGTSAPVRIHGAFVSDDEVHRVASHLKAQATPDYIDGVLEGASADDVAGSGGSLEGGDESDPLYDQAVEVILQNNRASISLVQRHLKIGYNRAARLLEQMERSGIVSSMSSNGSRDILVPTSEKKGTNNDEGDNF